MKAWVESCRQWLQGLEPRDRRVLFWGAPAILLLVLYLLLVQPLLARYQAAAATHEQLRSTLVWLLAQREELQRTNSFCSQALEPVAAADAGFVLEAQARRMGVTASVQSAGTDRLALAISAAPGNAVLGLVREMACRGFPLAALEIARTGADNDLVNGRLEWHIP